MRVGFIGSLDDHESLLIDILMFLVDEQQVDELIYLAVDGRLRRYAAQRYAELNHGDSSSTIWDRSVRCVFQAANEIDIHLERERARAKIDRLRSLEVGQVRSLQLSGNSRASVCFDRTQLDDATLRSSSVVIFGKDVIPSVRQVGDQFLLCPGSLSNSGLMVLESDGAGLHLKLFDRHFAEVAVHHLAIPEPSSAA